MFLLTYEVLLMLLRTSDSWTRCYFIIAFAVTSHMG